MMTIIRRLENLERQHKPIADDGGVWLAWYFSDFAECGTQTKSRKQLEAEGSTMIALKWAEERI